MKKPSLVFLLIISFMVTLVGTGASEPPIIPWPKEIKITKGEFELSEKSRIIYNDSELKPLARVFAEDLLMTTGIQCAVSSGEAKDGDIKLSYDKQLQNEAHKIDVTPKRILITGGNYKAVGLGTVTIVQSAEVFRSKVSIPVMAIRDQPEHPYRGILIDVARKYHRPQNLKDVVQMCRLYKINYIQLHLTDDQLFTFPSKAFPKLATTKSGAYTLEELKDVVKYGDERGVTFIPELETPGHSAKLRKVHPFGIKGASAVNVASEETYEAFDKLIGEICEVFKSSPYFHMGGDEVSPKGLLKTDAEKAYMKKHGLNGKWHDIYCHHIARINEIIKKYGKQTIVWDSFRGTGTKNAPIPTDVIVMVWRGDNKPGVAVKNGYPIINACWKPLYVVNSRAWSPKYTYETWHVRKWNHHLFAHLQHELKEDQPVMGAQMCNWEQPETSEIPSARWRLPTMSERVYNPGAGRTFADYEKRFAKTDELLNKLLAPIEMTFTGLAGDPLDRAFHEKIKIEMKTPIKGATIRYTIFDGNKYTGNKKTVPKHVDPTSESSAYNKALEYSLDDLKVAPFLWYRGIANFLRDGKRLLLSASVFDKNGRRIGATRYETFHGFVPKSKTVWYYGPKYMDHSKKRWADANIEGKTAYKEVLWPYLTFGRPHASRGVMSLATYSGVKSTGNIEIKEDGEYAFNFYSKSTDMVKVFIDNQLVVHIKKGIFNPIKLKKGIHKIETHYVHIAPGDKGRQTLSFIQLEKGESIGDVLQLPAKDAKNAQERLAKPKTKRWRDHKEILLPLSSTSQSMILSK